MPDNNVLQQQLDALRPVIAPPPIPFWPPAPGWYALGIIILCACVALCIWWWRRHCFLRDTQYRREAAALLASTQSTNMTPHEQLTQIAQILRRAAISAWGRDHAGTENWTQLITRIPADIIDADSLALLDRALYRATPPSDASLQKLYTQVELWLQQLPPLKGGAA